MRRHQLGGEQKEQPEEISLEIAAGVPPCGPLEEEFVINSKGTWKPLEYFFKKHFLFYFYLFLAALSLHVCAAFS